MLPRSRTLTFWLNVAAATLLMVMTPPSRARVRARASKAAEKTERPFGEPRSSEEPAELELRRAGEHGRGRHAVHPLQIP